MNSRYVFSALVGVFAAVAIAAAASTIRHISHQSPAMTTR
jgi:hypothetical protein